MTDDLPPPGVLRDDGERVQCHICGRWFVRLAGHLQKTHNTNAREYKIEFGLAQRHPLASVAYVENQRKNGDPERGRKALAIMHAAKLHLHPDSPRVPIAQETRIKHSERLRGRKNDTSAARSAAFRKEPRFCADCGAHLWRARIYKNREVVCPDCRYKRLLAAQRAKYHASRS